ncbi:hypothetical protein J2W24_006132 [Variovorax boronicumulans]|nr:hypothetical protein [Variovorax boronicumulans]
MRERREEPLLFGCESALFWGGMNLIIATAACDTQLQHVNVEMTLIIGC